MRRSVPWAPQAAIGDALVVVRFKVGENLFLAPSRQLAQDLNRGGEQRNRLILSKGGPDPAGMARPAAPIASTAPVRSSPACCASWAGFVSSSNARTAARTAMPASEAAAFPFSAMSSIMP